MNPNHQRTLNSNNYLFIGAGALVLTSAYSLWRSYVNLNRRIKGKTTPAPLTMALLTPEDRALISRPIVQVVQNNQAKSAVFATTLEPVSQAAQATTVEPINPNTQTNSATPTAPKKSSGSKFKQLIGNIYAKISGFISNVARKVFAAVKAVFSGNWFRGIFASKSQAVAPATVTPTVEPKEVAPTASVSEEENYIVTENGPIMTLQFEAQKSDAAVLEESVVPDSPELRKASKLSVFN